MNDKQAPTHIPFKKGDAENCLDFIMITKGLETRTRNYKLDVDREWTPARAVPTGKGIGPGKEYTRGQPSDHKAQKVTLLLDIVEKGNEGNRAIINYNNKEGWILYKTLSNKYAKEIMETVPKYKNKNKSEWAFKQIMHRLDIECFGIKYKKAKTQQGVWENINIGRLRNYQST